LSFDAIRKTHYNISHTLPFSTLRRADKSLDQIKLTIGQTYSTYERDRKAVLNIVRSGSVDREWEGKTRWSVYIYVPNQTVLCLSTLLIQIRILMKGRGNAVK
jgi:hypothetical protein